MEPMLSLIMNSEIMQQGFHSISSNVRSHTEEFTLLQCNHGFQLGLNQEKGKEDMKDEISSSFKTSDIFGLIFY